MLVSEYFRGVHSKREFIGAICGAVAGAYYGVPDEIRVKAETFLDARLLETLHAFEVKFSQSFNTGGWFCPDRNCGKQCKISPSVASTEQDRIVQ